MVLFGRPPEERERAEQLIKVLKAEKDKVKDPELKEEIENIIEEDGHQSLEKITRRLLRLKIQ